MDMLKKIVEESRRIVPRPRYVMPKLSGTMMILAPHYDDDVIGCGGVIHQYTKMGKEVHVVFMTNGRRGTVKNAAEDAMVQIRKKEAEQGLKRLGVAKEQIHYLELEDSNLLGQVPLGAERLTPLLERYQPEFLFLPYINDIHPDHRATNYVLGQLLSSSDAFVSDKAQIFLYEVWTPLIPNTCIDITKEMDVKLAALKEHKSQVEVMPYLTMTSSLNRYRACFCNMEQINYVEAFYRCSKEEYSKLLNKQMNGGLW